MMLLYEHHFNKTNLSIRDKINQINQIISDHEREIANPLLDYIHKREDLRLIGKSKISNKNRAPTISFICKNKTSKEISDSLITNNIATRNDNFYAWRCLNALNIDPNDGVVRLSLTHYNSNEETTNLINIIESM